MKVQSFIWFSIIAAIILPAGAYRILGIFSYPGKSHFIMYEALLKALAERSHQVDVVSHFSLRAPFPNYNQIVNLNGTVATVQNNVTYETIKRIGKMGVVRFIVTQIGNDFCDLMDHPRVRELIKNPLKEPPYDILIVDILGATCYLALGQHLKVPVVGIVASAMWPWANAMVANPDNPAYIPSVFSGLSTKMNFWERIGNTLELIKEKWEFNYYSAVQDEKIQKYIGTHASSLREAERNVSLILVNSHYSLNGVRPYTQAVVEVGGLHISENVDPLPNELEKWLNDSKDGCLYISLGSMAKIETFPEKTLRVLYSSIAKLSPVRVLMKVVNPKELPPGLPNNVLTQPWIAQLAVLRHKNVRAFMTHGGLMGTQEAVYCGIPIIGVPLFGDQYQNIELYVRKHVAVSLHHEQLTEDNLDFAFNAVLNDRSYMEAAKKLSAQFRDRPMSAKDTAVFWVEYVARYGGTILRSTAMDLTWWQISLLDVYGVLLLAIFLVVCLFKLVIVKFIVLFTNRHVRRVVESKKIK